jgi:AcrR family transcriptional regulator
MTPTGPDDDAPLEAHLLGKRERGKRERARRIREATKAVFQEKGYSDATMREIATRASVGTGTLFRYAPDKRGLLIAVINDELEPLTNEAFERLDREASFLDQIAMVFRERYRYWGRNPELSLRVLQEVLLQGAGDTDPASPIGRYHQRRASLIERISALVAEHQRRGTIAADENGTEIAELCMALYLAEVRMWLRNGGCDLEAGIARLRRLLRLALLGVTPSCESGANHF